jgi:tetratricopeptide (TPR) repeat protein/predicted Ser/Thr protein kinase
MDSERYQKITDLFDRLSELGPQERSAELEKIGRADPELRREVEAFLHQNEELPAFLRTPVIDDVMQRKSAPLSSAIDDAPMPDRIGRYTIRRKLGEGGMGVVYLAEQDEPRRPVAVKVVRPEAMSGQMRRRFQQEARVLGLLRHPGIAQIYEAGTALSDGRELAYFAMEYVEGTPLTEFADNRRLSHRARLELLAGICDAIHHAHQKGVVHRDLKPENILVDPTGQSKVLDFGVASATNADIKTLSIQTQAAQLIGTLPYMSPEQALGDPDAIDTRCDVYALGVIAYELLARKLPLDLQRRAIVEAARIIREEEPKRLGQLSRLFRGDIETIVAKALEKDRDHRYASAAELGADIRRFLHDDPIVARPPSAIYQMRKFARRHRGVAVGVCISALALILGSAVAIWQALEARSAQRMAERRFADLQEFAQSITIEYPNIQGTQGDTRAREFLTKTTMQYLDGMAKDTHGLDLKVLENLALAYSATGDILGRPNGPNLGDPKAARESYKKAVALLDDLVSRDPDNIERKRKLAITCERIGNIYLTDQQYDQALEVFRKSHALKQAVADKHEMGPRDLSFSYNKLGDVYVKLGRTQEAYDMYVQSLDIRKQIAERKPQDGEIQRAYTVGLNRVADVLLELGRNTEALERCEASLQRRMDWAASQPDNAQATMDLAVGHFKRAQVLARLDRVDDALPAFESARTILRRMADADPSNTTSCTGAAEVSGEMGRVLFEAGRLEAALPELTAYTQEMERCMPDDKMVAVMREQLAAGHLRRGQALVSLARAEHAGSEQIQQHEADGCKALHRAEQLYESLGDDGRRVPPELRSELENCERPIDSG